MSARPQRIYRFATLEQWSACLFERVNLATLDNARGISPFAPFALPPRLLASAGAFAPAAARDGEEVWRDGNGGLYRLTDGDALPVVTPTPTAIGKATRIVATTTSLWVASGAPDSLQCFDRKILASRFVVELTQARVLDLAGDGCDGVWALIEAQGTWKCVHVDCAGAVAGCFALRDIDRPTQLTFLRRFDRLVVLAADGAELDWFAPGDGDARLVLALNSIRPCFKAIALGSDAQSRVVAAGIDNDAFGGGKHVVCIDGDANALGDVALPSLPTGVNATADALLVTTGDGLLRFAPSGPATTVSAETSCSFVTPALQSPINDNPRRWLRVEAIAKLPAGCTLEIGYATTDDPDVRDQAERITADPALPASRRLSRLRDLLRDWQAPLALPGSDTTADSSVPLAAPLFDVRHPYLWVSVRLIAAPGATLPILSELRVLYPGHTLMEQLPAIYQRQEAESGDFLRALVGVIESTTQSLDARIGSMGSLVDPATAPVDWLNYVARWIGAPWDDALDEQQKRLLLQHANAIASMRGTRRALETLLACLMPGTPPRYRLVDFTVDYGFATLGGSVCGGTALPALLGGLPSSGLALGRKAFLGRARLPCAANVDDDISGFVGQLDIQVMASAQQRRAWEPWLANLVAAVVPATTRVHLRWLSPSARLWNDRLDDDGLTLEAEPMPHLGTDAVTGLARLPADRGVVLPSVGLDLGSRLQ